ncbi:unnamed protein product, partial [marine sediment metagenome]
PWPGFKQVEYVGGVVVDYGIDNKKSNFPADQTIGPVAESISMKLKTSNSEFPVYVLEFSFIRVYVE